MSTTDNNDKYKLKRRGNGFYYVSWTIRKTTPSGRETSETKRVSTRTADRHQAERFRAQLIAGLEAPQVRELPTITELLDLYFEHHAIDIRSSETFKHNRKHLDGFFGLLTPREITSIKLKEYAKDRRKTKNAKDGTILREIGVLRTALSYAAGNDWIDAIPSLKSPISSPPPKRNWFTQEEVNTLISKAKSPHIQLFCVIAISTGARSGAILELKWSQIDLERKLVDFGIGHGNKRRTIAPMNNELFYALKEAQKLAVSDYVIEYHESPVHCVKKAIGRLCKDNNINGSAHVFRHTVATWLKMAGVDSEEVAALLGDTKETIERVYGHFDPKYLNKASTTIDELRGAKNTKLPTENYFWMQQSSAQNPVITMKIEDQYYLCGSDKPYKEEDLTILCNLIPQVHGTLFHRTTGNTQNT